MLIVTKRLFATKSLKEHSLKGIGDYGVNLNRKGGMDQHIEDWKKMFENRQKL